MSESFQDEAVAHSRYSVTCPACGASFRPGKQSPMGFTTFHCPVCSQLLEFVNENEQLAFWTSVSLAIIATYLLGYRGLMFAAVALVIGSVLLFAIVGVRYHIWPPKVQPTFRGPNVELRLRDKPPD